MVMWSRLYRNHVMMAFPTYDSAKHAWAPQVDINWFSGPSHDSKFVKFPNRFLTEDEAVNWALARGQRWVDNHLRRLENGASGRRRLFDMIGAFDQNLQKASPRRARTAQAVIQPNTRQNLTFKEFASLLAQKGLRLNLKTLQKSYAALVKVRKSKGWSWAETKRKVQRAHHAAAPAGALHRLPLCERDWRRVH
jgi:hypothetical protein